MAELKHTTDDSGISYILGSYNRKLFLQKTLESIRKEKINRPREIIVVDGGSTDGSIKYLSSQKDVITILQHNHGKWNYKKIERKSWGYFMNLAMKIAQNKYVCMLSDDCLLVSGAVENAISSIKKANEANRCVGGGAFYFRDYPIERDYKIHHTYGDRIAINHGIYLNEALRKVNYIDEDRYQFYCADGDLSLRLWESGYEIIRCSDSFVEHHAHAPARLSHSNKDQYFKDMKASRERWASLIKTSGDLGEWEYISFNDKDNTAKSFPSGSWRGRLFYLTKNILKRILTKYDNS